MTAGEAYTFPPLFLDPERAMAHENEFGNPEDHSALWALPALQYEMIAVPEGLIPPAIDNDADVLPSEQHPSYPYGNPYAGLSSQVNTPFASRPLLDPKLHLNLELAHAAEARARARNEDPPIDDVFANMTNTGIQNAGVAPSAAYADGGGPSAQDHALAHHLQLRAATSHGPTNPIWPFKKYGPGRMSSSTPSGGAAALLRAERERVQLPLREVWADLALEALLPRGKVLPFQNLGPGGALAMPSQQRQPHNTNRSEADPLQLGLQAPDRVGAQIPGSTAVRPPGAHDPNHRPASSLREDYLEVSVPSATVTGSVEERLARAMALTGVRDYVESQPQQQQQRQQQQQGSSQQQEQRLRHERPREATDSEAARQTAARMRSIVSRIHRQQHQHLRPAESQGQGTGPWPFILPQPPR
ncbi:hypothetical protein OC846_005766 [Tilletia horrida]|uniref:Uncharacterized protein n=1 Tax=Tilletia horrida TaxID=155126 RepID=A0AAN6JPL3_9BASI|nr:hypothetical protein OC845_005897 [Tilletia horrida]KAK0545206.1 hypothetical protein OC846_005766 [Tilletia horrida]